MQYIYKIVSFTLRHITLRINSSKLAKECALKVLSILELSIFINLISRLIILENKICTL